MLDLEKSKKYVLACSFGPDSMALFSMLYNEGYSFVVAHVNYHKRDVSNYEEESLRQYCRDRNIEIEVLSAPHSPEKVNFQEWARELRYSFFKDVCEKHSCNAVLVAHQQDDFIETYLMQKERGSDANFYGISAKTIISDVLIIRPLLAYTKKELREYDDEHLIPYSIDCSNLTNDYTRNRIRHEIVEKLSVEERNNLLIEAQNGNNTKSSIILDEYISDDSLIVNKIISVSPDLFVLIMHKYLNQIGFSVEVSKYFFSELQKALSSKKPSFVMSSSGLEFVKEYNLLYVRTHRTNLNYSYTIKQPQILSTDYFEIDLRGDTSDRNITLGDYPLTIRNANKDDKYIIGENIVSLRRAFIDWKMPPSLRDRWPVILNKDNKVIYVPRYRKSFIDKHKTKFVIYTDKLKA